MALKGATHANAKVSPAETLPTDMTVIDEVGGSRCDLPMLRSLMRAIAKDDVVKLREIMNALDDHLRFRVMNGNVPLMRKPPTVETSVWHCTSLVKQLRVHYPLSTAVVYQSLDCFKELVDMGADLFITDVRGNNLLHLFVYAHKDQPTDIPRKMYDLILGKLKTCEERQTLLYHSSDDGLRPLDLSAKLCCSSLFRAFLYTEGAYRTIVSQEGKIVTNRFRLPSRKCDTENRSASFLWQLVWMDEKLECLQAIEAILCIPAVKALTSKRLRAVSWFLVVWGFLRCMQGIIFAAGDVISDDLYRQFGVNETTLPNQTFAYWLILNRSNNTLWATIATGQVIYGCGFGCITLMVNTAELIVSMRLGGVMRSGLVRKLSKSGVINSFFYRVVMIVLAMHLLVAMLLQLPVFRIEQLGDIMAILFLNVRVLICFSVMYFLQLVPIFGSFVIGFQKMLAALAKFAILQLSAMALFTTLFRHVRMYFCVTGSASHYVMDSMYSTFLTMLNMVTVVPEPGTCDETGVNLMKITHVLYVFIVAVLTVNYLIAIMSSVYSFFSEQMSSAVRVHRIYAFLVVERRLRILSTILSYFTKRKTTTDTAEIIEVEEIDRDHDFENLRLDEGPFGEYCVLGVGRDELYTGK